MKTPTQHVSHKHSGFSLIEILVGLVIGLLATLVIMDVFSGYEEQKRTTTGNSDAQTNGAVALFNLQRDLQSAGYGLPVYNANYSPFNCPINTTIDHDNDASTANINLSPVVITDGGTGSDVVAIHAGDSMRGGVGVDVTSANAISPAVVDTNIGCQKDDVVLLVNYADENNLNCRMARIDKSQTFTSNSTTVTLKPTTLTLFNDSLSCLGTWNEFRYSVVNNQLTRTGSVSAITGYPTVYTATNAPAIVSDIVNIQAQYGISANPTSNTITSWVDATGSWQASALTPTTRNRIKAIRVAIVARNGILEKKDVTVACATNTNGLCAWTNGPNVVLSGTPDWKRYHYRIYESIYPLKNVIWSRGSLK